jgi:hypothetical protein
MIHVNGDADGKPIFTSWVPSKNDLESANEVYIDEDHKAAMKVKANDDGEKVYYELVSRNSRSQKRLEIPNFNRNPSWPSSISRTD